MYSSASLLWLSLFWVSFSREKHGGATNTLTKHIPHIRSSFRRCLQ